jgi:hypothetical protein
MVLSLEDMQLVRQAYGIPIFRVKAILLQAWTGPDGSRRFRIPDFKTIGT